MRVEVFCADASAVQLSEVRKLAAEGGHLTPELIQILMEASQLTDCLSAAQYESAKPLHTAEWQDEVAHQCCCCA